MLAFLAALKRRRHLLMILAASSMLVIGGATFLHGYNRDSLLDFVDQDLRKLKDEPRSIPEKALAYFFPDQFRGSRTRLNRLLDRELPAGFLPTSLFGFQPWYFWRLEAQAEPRYVLFQVKQTFKWKDPSPAAIHFFDSNGTHKGYSEIAVPWPNEVLDASLGRHGLFDCALIEIKTHHVFPQYGLTASRSFVAIEDRVALLRIEDGDGKLVANSYPRHVGPPLPPRIAAEWEELLRSSRRPNVLEALTWIGCNHRQWPELATPKEIEASRLITEVRAMPAVHKRIAELTTSENPWIREAAELAMQQLPNKGKP